MRISMYQNVLMERGVYCITPTYLAPKQKPVERDGFIGLINERMPKPEPGTFSSIDELSAEMKDALRSWFVDGWNHVTLEQWDNFLLDLVDLGLITNSERMHVNGMFVVLPEAAADGRYHLQHTDGKNPLKLMDQWNGDPLHYLNALDIYQLRAQCNAALDGHGTKGIASQRTSCIKISNIVKQLFSS